MRPRQGNKAVSKDDRSRPLGMARPPPGHGGGRQRYAGDGIWFLWRNFSPETAPAWGVLRNSRQDREHKLGNAVATNVAAKIDKVQADLVAHLPRGR